MNYIYHHLGLGDHIICNGLVRHFAEKYEEVTVFCKSNNYENVSYMFRDDKKIIISPHENDRDVLDYIKINNLSSNVFMIGFGNLWSKNPSTFDIGFYDCVNLPFDIRFNKFKLERDYETEKKVLEEMNPNNDDYIFVHDDPERNFLIDNNKLRSDLKIIKNNTNYSIFEMLGVIENATEVHLMQSSFKDLVNSIKIDKPKFFYHSYVRKYPNTYNTQGLNKFEIIK